MSTYRSGYPALAAFLLAASPSPSLAQKDGPLKMVYAVWGEPGAAAET